MPVNVDDGLQNNTQVLAAAGMMVFSILCVLCSLAYVVTGIVYLVMDRDTCKDGDRDTALWIFCLTYIVSGSGAGIVANCICPYKTPQQLESVSEEEGGEIAQEVKDNNDMNLRVNFGFLAVVSIAFFCAGTMFLTGDIGICDELHSSGLYVWFIISYVLICLTFIFYVFTLISNIVGAMVDDDESESKKALSPVSTSGSYQQA